MPHFAIAILRMSINFIANFAQGSISEPQLESIQSLSLMNMSANRMKKQFALLATAILSALAVTSSTVHATDPLSKVANLPLWQSAETSPQSPRGGILQIGDDLWFMTYSGGEYSIGAISSYNLVTQQFTTQYSFGWPNPEDPYTIRHDGNNPWKSSLFLGDDGKIYYTTMYGGVSNTGTSNGGAIGVFDPVTGTAEVAWSGGSTGTQPRILYNEPAYINRGSGVENFYFVTYAGGSAGSGSVGWGTVQKATLTNGVLNSTETLADLWTDTNARQSQAGMLLVGDKIYYTTASAAGGASPTLQMIDTITDQITILSNSWTTGGNNGGWNTPLYDEVRNAIYSVALSGGILKWDINTDTQSILPNSDDGGASNFADPILLNDVIYYVKQSNGGSVWAYNLEYELLMKIADLSDYGGNASSQSGSMSLVYEDGLPMLYFLTAGSDGNNFGALFRLDPSLVVFVPEPSSLWLLMGAGLFALRHKRKKQRAKTLS